MNNEIRYRMIVIIMIVLLVPIYTLSIYIHECGHAIAVIMSGGDIIEFYVDIDSGYVKCLAPTDAMFLIGLMGGVFQALFFSILSKYNKAFNITTILCLIYAVVEAFEYDMLYGKPLGTLVFYSIAFATIYGMGLAYDNCYGENEDG